MRGYRHRRAFYAALRADLSGPAVRRGRLLGATARAERPSLFIWGDRDWLVPSAFEHHVRRAVPQAESVVLADCGHVPQFEHPTETNALIHNFLTAPERLY